MGAEHSTLAYPAEDDEAAPLTTVDEDAHAPHVASHHHLRPGGPFRSRTLFGRKQKVLHLAVQESNTASLRQLLNYLHAWIARQSAGDAASAVTSLVNTFDSHQMTPLMLACQQGDSEAAHLLLDHGADPLLADRAGNNSMHLAARGRHVSCIQELLSWEANQSRGNEPRLANSRNGCGYTPLHFLVWHRCREGAELLLSAGASLTARNTLQGWDIMAVGDGNTPLHLAALRGSTTMAKTLLSAYLSRGDRARRVPDPRLLPDGDGRVPFEVAQMRGHVQLLVVLNPTVEWQEIFGDGAEVAHLFSPGTLAEMAAAQLRWKLLAELEQIESADTAPSSAPLARTLSLPLRRHPSGCPRTPQDDPCCIDASTTPPSTPDACGVLGPDQHPFSGHTACSSPLPDSLVSRPHLPHWAATSSGHAPAPTSFSPLSGLPVPCDGASTFSASSSSNWEAASQGDDDGSSDADNEDEMCGICLEAGEQLVHLQPCRHFTCAHCMKQLLNTLKLGAPPACPFCRGYIGALK